MDLVSDCDYGADVGVCGVVCMERIKMDGYKVSIGELIDKLSIVNIKMWHMDEAMSKATDKAKAGEYALIARDLNRERSDLREEINIRLEGQSRGSNKIEYTGVGR